MPYIKAERRDKILLSGNILNLNEIRTAGDINFAIQAIALAYLYDDGSQNYLHLNTVVGAIEAAKLEFYRRVVVPYEDTKIAENGDVF